MIQQILADKAHAAMAASQRSEDDTLTMLKLLGGAVAERLPVDLRPLYGDRAYPLDLKKNYTVTARQGTRVLQKGAGRIVLPVGGKAPSPVLPTEACHQLSHASSAMQKPHESMGSAELGVDESMQPHATTSGNFAFQDIIEKLKATTHATAEAHQTFLQLSNDLSRAYAETFDLQTRLLVGEMLSSDVTADGDDVRSVSPGRRSRPVFSREDCMEFAVGSVAKVLGPEFSVVDTYKARVRLPDDPLMLVDRIMEISGEKGSLQNGRILTEHDVHDGAWYLDGDRAPVCIAVEAGQADLFLSSYLGIDHAVKGQRTYRLLDATVTFFRGLPRPGETIRYEIEIEKFIRQKETYLFFFHFKGFIDNQLLIQMKDGCAGFFTEEEVRKSGGIITSSATQSLKKGPQSVSGDFAVPVARESYSEKALDALRLGNLRECFGPAFEGKSLATSLRLPGGRMRLIDRVQLLDPEGGAWGLGLIRAEADIHPDDWFLTCHFVDDMVMPGTLMYECCAHTLRVFLQRIGWITDKKDACYEPVTGIESVLKCRGPVTPETRHVVYEIEIRELGYHPEPYAIADAHIIADGRPIVFFDSISMQLSHTTPADILEFWRADDKKEEPLPADDHRQVKSAVTAGESATSPVPVFTRGMLEAFAYGNPSQAFGAPYRIFDEKRFIARLPRPPYLFMDRVIAVEPEAWVLKPDGWMTSQVDIHPEDWYFHANRVSAMPMCVLNEIALQPCGWLAAYMGSALKSQQDLRFRNLGGNAVIHRQLRPANYTLTTRARLTQTSMAGDMIIEQYDFEVMQSHEMVYEGTTNFGFFTREALASQIGIRGVDPWSDGLSPEEVKQAPHGVLTAYVPESPEDRRRDPGAGMAMPATAIRMIDRIDAHVPDSGPKGLGYICGSKPVDPDAWFFKAHFYQDPVCPGSLGLDAMIQLLKFMAEDRWRHLRRTHMVSLATGQRHQWTYRGQITPTNKRMEIHAIATHVQESPCPEIHADGVLKVDGLCIYKLENFGIRLEPVEQ
jgi:3-hydroxymyristoyl/3-hydroxydecanoyl-(acyl carrier protein) dehydratase